MSVLKRDPKRFIVIFVITMVGAIWFDLVEILLGLLGVGIVINTAVGIVKWVVFVIWSFIIKLDLLKKPSRLVTVIITFIAGLMPAINILPEFSIGVAIALLIDEVNFKELGGKAFGVDSGGKNEKNIKRPRRSSGRRGGLKGKLRNNIVRSRRTPPPLPKRGGPPPLPGKTPPPLPKKGPPPLPSKTPPPLPRKNPPPLPEK